MKYCKQGIYSWLLCDTEAFQLIIFQVEWFSLARICLLQFVVGRFVVVVSYFLLFVGRFRSLLGQRRLFQVVSGRFRLFRALVSTQGFNIFCIKHWLRAFFSKISALICLFLQVQTNRFLLSLKLIVLCGIKFSKMFIIILLKPIHVYWRRD